MPGVAEGDHGAAGQAASFQLLLAEADAFLKERYTTLVMYATFALAMCLAAVYMAYKTYGVALEYRFRRRVARGVLTGDNVDDPRNDDEERMPLWGSAEGAVVPRGSAIRHRLDSYSRFGGRDLAGALDPANDAYESDGEGDGDGDGEG
eukprot:jgi/Tetstr1/466214/TSEL_010772.t1